MEAPISTRAAAIRCGIARARAAGVRLGRPLNLSRNPEIAAALARGWGIAKTAAILGVGRNAVRRVRDEGTQ